MRRSGVGFLDSPVSGSTVVARRGQARADGRRRRGRDRPGAAGAGRPRHRRARRSDRGRAPRRRSPSTGCCTRSAPRCPSAWSRPAAEGVSADALFDVLAGRRAVEPLPGLQAARLQRPGAQPRSPSTCATATKDLGLAVAASRRGRAVRVRRTAALSSCTSRRSKTASATATWPPWRPGSAESRQADDDSALAGAPASRRPTRKELTWASTRTARTRSTGSSGSTSTGCAPSGWRGCARSWSAPRSVRSWPSTSPTSAT